jgi:L-ascorbate metabolism protein UlaG (beta-lactamase superfamily)
MAIRRSQIVVGSLRCYFVIMQPEFNITWVGHATTLVEVDGFQLITDPILTSRVAHLRRRVELGDIPPLEAVLISHLHMDHLHLRSLKQVAAGTQLVCPSGAASLMRSLRAAAVVEVVAGDVLTLRPEGRTPAITATVVPADHSNQRGPHSRLVAEPVGYVIRCGDRSVYFAGDTDLFDGMAQLGPIDVALIPIWGWGPTLGERHLNPRSAAAAVQVINPRRVVPIHWGTYSPIRPRPGSPTWLENPLGEFERELAAVELGDRLVALRPGGHMHTVSSLQ